MIREYEQCKEQNYPNCCLYTVQRGNSCLTQFITNIFLSPVLLVALGIMREISISFRKYYEIL